MKEKADKLIMLMQLKEEDFGANIKSFWKSYRYQTQQKNKAKGYFDGLDEQLKHKLMRTASLSATPASVVAPTVDIDVCDRRQTRLYKNCGEK